MSEPLVNDPAPSPAMELLRENALAAALAVLLLLNLAGLFQYIFGLDTAIVITLLAGYKTFYNSISALLEKRVSADLALCVAVIAALWVGEYRAAAEAMLIVMAGETLESYAVGRTEAAIRRFVAQLPRVARLWANGREVEVDAATLAPGDRIAVRAGERIPADGVIEQGVSSIDESSITGESLPADKEPGSEVFSGALNGHGLLRIRVTRAGSETTLARVAALVEEAKQQRAPVERLADRYARYFLPALLLAGALTYYFTGNWLRTVAVLIVACPCALILATPTAMVAAIGGLARRGILVRGGAVLQVTAEVDTVVFDKTGTVTEGRFEIAKVTALDGSEDELLALAASAERASDHALARIVVEEARRRGLAVPEPEEARVLPGRGVESTVSGRVIRAGTEAFLGSCGIAYREDLRDYADRTGATPVAIAVDGRLAGAIFLRDRIRPGAREAVARLQQMGIARMIMLTGDRLKAAEAMAREVGIRQVEAELLPEQKQERIRQLAAQGCRVAMLGDGINDAPALAAAGVGIAVAGASDLAAEAAGVVYLPHSLDRMPLLFEASRRAVRTAWLNIVLFAGALNLLAVLACATGKLGPMGAAFTHQLSSFCVMMNSLRLLRVGQPSPAQWRLRLERRLAERGLPEAWRRLREFRPGEAILWLADRRERLLKPGLAAAAVLVILGGFYSVQPDEVGVIERFGRKVTPFSQPGLHYKLPWPVERITRIRAHRVRVVEIGFRSNAGVREDSVAYEWNVPHRTGRIQIRPEESRMLTGDQNMIEVNATVHYVVEQPDSFLFRQIDGDATVREAAESVIHGMAGTRRLDDVLTEGRESMERQALAELQRRADRYDTGIRVLQVKLEDVHPSLEVVDAFRDVSAAFEEKNRLIDEAEAYRNERVALARGNARALLANANAYTIGRANRATGDASRFTQAEQAYRAAPGPTETRLYLETLEQVLPGRKKLIVDSGKGRRHLVMMEDGIEIGPPGAALLRPNQ